MKIAAYFGDISPTVGGGFTIQDDIFRALLEVREKERHSFVIYSNLTAQQRTGVDPSHLQWERTHAERWNKLQSWLELCFPFIPFIRSSLHQRGWFERTLRRHRVDLVWFVTPTFQQVDVPYVYTIWDLQHRLQPWFPEVSSNGRWYFREERYWQVITRAAAVIAPNNAGKDEVMRFYQLPPERVKIIPHPTPSFALEAAEGDSRAVLEKYRLPAGYLLYPAQFWPHKNHVNLLAAVKRLKELEGVVLPVVFVGSDQGNAEYVKSVVDELGLGGHVHFLGFVSREDLIGLYRNGLALAYPTFFGPENLPPLEAFALGCPVVASRVSGAEEQLGDAALLVDPTDVDGFAAALHCMYRNPELRQCLIRKGRERALRWTAKDYVREVLTIFDEFEAVRRCWPAVM